MTLLLCTTAAQRVKKELSLVYRGRRGPAHSSVIRTSIVESLIRIQLLQALGRRLRDTFFGLAVLLQRS